MSDVTIVIAVVGAIAALAAAVVAVLALKTTAEIAETQLFLELRRSHSEVHAHMDPRYHDKTWDPTKNPADAAALRTLERYWLHTSTEWFATTKLNKGKFSRVWKDFYEKAILAGLKNEPLRIALCHMLDGGSSFSGQREEFQKEIKTLYALNNDNNGRTLCEDKNS